MQRFYLGLFFVLAGWCLHALADQEWLGYVVMSSGLLMVAAGMAALGALGDDPLEQLNARGGGPILHGHGRIGEGVRGGVRARAGAMSRQRL